MIICDDYEFQGNACTSGSRRANGGFLHPAISSNHRSCGQICILGVFQLGFGSRYAGIGNSISANSRTWIRGNDNRHVVDTGRIGKGNLGALGIDFPA